MQKLFDRLIAQACQNGADHAAVISAREITTDRAFRAMCEANSCGMYGKCYTCPPDAGEIDALISSLANYDRVLVYQHIEHLEDSFDVEGMQRAREVMFRLSQYLRDCVSEADFRRVLHLTAGACGVCKRCAKQDGIPCRFPDRATASLEAYGIHVAKLAESAGMKYINGANTVTYFGAILFSVKGE